MAEIIDITVKVVEALALPASGRVDYRDSKTPGLYLRVSAGGAKTFSLVGRAKGSSRVERVTIGKYPAVRPDEARRKAAMLNGALAGGTSPATALRGKRDEITLRSAAELYLASLKRRNTKSDSPESLWRLYVEPQFCNRRMSDIKAVDLERWHRALPGAIRQRHAKEKAAREQARVERRERIVAAQAATRRRGPEPKPRVDRVSSKIVTGNDTANQALALVRAIYHWCAKPQQAYYIGVNPATGHTLFPKRVRERFLQPDELGPFFQALAQEANPTMRDFILLALLTGARRANVVSMAWSDVDLEMGAWRVAGELMKNGEPQTITLSPEALAVLRQRCQEHKGRFVFPSARAESGHIRDPRKAWERTLRAAGLTDLRLHDLRRTLGSWQARTGASLLLIGKSLNHKSPEATAIYAKLDLDPVRQSVDRATSAMLEAAGMKDSAQVIPVPGTDRMQQARPGMSHRRPAQ